MSSCGRPDVSHLVNQRIPYTSKQILTTCRCDMSHLRNRSFTKIKKKKKRFRSFIERKLADLRTNFLFYPQIFFNRCSHDDAFNRRRRINFLAKHSAPCGGMFENYLSAIADV